MDLLPSQPSSEPEQDHFIPARKIDVLSAVIKHGALTGEPEQVKFRQFCRLLGAIHHYEYFEKLERLRNDYFYFSPDLDGKAQFDPAMVERTYGDMLDALTTVLHGANFVEVQHDEIERAHRDHGVVRVNIQTSLDDYRDVRFFRRGHRKEKLEVSEWFGWRKRSFDIDVYDDVVLLVTMKGPECAAANGARKRARKPKVRPGAVLLKYFRNIASADLNALFPDVRVVMGLRDQLWIGVPALVGGIPILLKLASTLTLLIFVAGFYLGLSEAVKDDEISGALAAIGGLVALGGFMLTQWMKFQRQSLLHQKTLSDNVYYRNINNNAGIFDYLIGEAEEQDCKEAFLAYYFLLALGGEATEADLDRRVEEWLRQTFSTDIDYECSDALAKLDRLGLLKRQGERLSVVPLDEALARLDRVWDNFFPLDGARQATLG
ncbi:MAG: TMEM143 family protein [Hyphomicrobiales bacterium]